MPFKINISEKSGKTYKLELESEEFIGKELNDKINGKILSPDLEGYEFEITGSSDKAGFTSHKDVPGIGLKKILLTYGKAMHRRPRKEGKFKVPNHKRSGLRLRKTVRGKVISPEIVQINLKTLKEGKKKLSEVFPDQSKAPESETPSEAPKTPEAPKTEESTNEEPKGKEETKAEEKPEEKDEGKGAEDRTKDTEKENSKEKGK